MPKYTKNVWQCRTTRHYTCIVLYCACTPPSHCTLLRDSHLLGVRDCWSSSDSSVRGAPNCPNKGNKNVCFSRTQCIFVGLVLPLLRKPSSQIFFTQIQATRPGHQHLLVEVVLGAVASQVSKRRCRLGRALAVKSRTFTHPVGVVSIFLSRGTETFTLMT